MKAEELMKGNWVTSEDLLNRPARYEGRYEDYTPLNGKPYRRLICLWPSDKEGASVPEERVLPVPLTPEILEKNGFEKQGFDGWLLVKQMGDGLAWSILWRTDGPSPHLRIDSYSSQTGSFSSFAVSYVHQLQQALRLCGIEKKIIL